MKSVYVALTHHFVKIKDEQNKWEKYEQCEFIDRLKNKHYDCASVIIDVKNRKLVKSRDDNDYQYYYEYVKSAYPEKFNELQEKYLNE